MKTKFSKVMSVPTDEELVQIVTTNRDIYQFIAKIKTLLNNIFNVQNTICY